MENQDKIMAALFGFIEMAQPMLLQLESKNVIVIAHKGLPYPYLTFKDSNIILCPFRPLKGS
jgi:hypothetical protein